jgi:hypothetical protein
MKVQRRTLLIRTLPAALAIGPMTGWAQSVDAQVPEKTLARFLYLLVPLPAFATADYDAASWSLLDKASRLPVLKGHVQALVQRLDAAGFMSLPLPAQLGLLKSVQGFPEFRYLSNPAWGVLNHKLVWPRIGYEGASFPLGGYRHRGFDDIDWLPASAKGGQ